jgi:hypothetical protein
MSLEQEKASSIPMVKINGVISFTEDNSVKWKKGGEMR